MELPVLKTLPGIRASLARNRSVVLCAPPGSGKTTGVPPALLDEPWLKGRKILMLEPRRLAARGAASFIARTLGEPVGGRVGYQVRLERKVSADTRLEIITEGLLTQRILADPELADVGLILFDEFHERSLQCDLGYALALDVRRGLRDDLRLVVMSATLDAQSIAAHLGDADIHVAEARMYPVETRYLQVGSTAPVWAQMAGAVRRIYPETTGSVLCFLPGEGEIRRTAEELRAFPNVFPLYGALTREEQDEAVRATDAKRVILATSIAETSLTIPGVTAVIDSGLMRVSRFSPGTGRSRLETLPVTRDRAEQRRGRAGRVAPGICLRLWTESEQGRHLPAMKPEILEADLASTVLACAEWGALQPGALPWLTPPPEGSWGRAQALLKDLGALGQDGCITAKGRRMTRLAAHPRLANMMLEGGDPLWAAIIEEGATHGNVDITAVRPTPRMRELARRWRAQCHFSEKAFAENAAALLAFAYPDRIGRNRGNGTFTLSGGGGAVVERTDPLATAPYLVFCELDDRGGDARARLAAALTEEDIAHFFAEAIRETTETSWDPKTESVRAVKVRAFGKMPLKCGGQSQIDPEAVRRALLEGIIRKGVTNLPCWTDGTRALQARICFLRAYDETWPDVSDAGLAQHAEGWLGPFLDGMSRWTHLAKLNLVQAFDAALAAAGHDRRELDRLMPVKMTVPSGSVVTIHYDEAEPYAQVRLQECFGLMETPKTAGGRVNVVMKLLSPAQRPIQITRDLARFWKESYPLVRKDMRGRYPKHYWPEDPFTAVATRRVKPRI